MDNKKNQNRTIIEDHKEKINDIIICQNKKIEELKLQLSQNQNKINDIKLRTLAKIENIQKNTLEQINIIKETEIEKFLKTIFPIIETLEDIIISSNSFKKKDQPFIEGIKLTLQSLLNILSKFGLKIEGKKNEVFNSKLHTSIAIESSSNILPNHIISVKKQGFTFNKVLLRKAIVIIAKK
ncbi:nucleotide exchange factor GrpE [Buchnera aphidicola (Macrosiphoniella sanborni)]|uniref:Protein GrpE n=1 Tax=Buchnera aphidicola (Macrosiphoniella sanborni) TaxID=1241865 RepID=A0A4D6Y3X5_9GAMM|nr:nucleotide exchange factor GrpE [Buchnera aphidicola]QCI23739.1 nucleotide exchange factor GrpE [Buchnera aphidicola (Macrosiphoniella sanborni)]